MKIDLLTSEQLQRLKMSCPACAEQIWLRCNFCPRCRVRVNDARYFAFLANWPRHRGPVP